MSDFVGQVLGRVMADQARALLSDQGHPALLLVKRLEDPVLLRLCQELEAFDFDGTGPRITIRVTLDEDDHFPELPDRFRFLSGENAVTLRNDDRVSLVILERDRSTAAQSLAQLPTLDDGSVVESDLASHDALPTLDAAWAEYGPGGDPPGSLTRALRDVLTASQAGGGIPARSWIEYVVACAGEVGRRAHSRREVWDVVGRNLTFLNLFRDSGLAELDSDGARARRLDSNFAFAADLDDKGRPIDADVLAAIAARTEFVDAEGRAITGTAHDEIVRDVTRRLFRLAGEIPPVIDFHVWQRLFKERERASGLGHRVAEEIAQAAPDRLEEYEALEVSSDLDARKGDAAEKLLAADPDNPDEPALVDLLSSRLHRAIERLAVPPVRTVDDPLRHLLRELYKLQQELDDPADPLQLNLTSSGLSDDNSRSLNLFRFLFGPTLARAFQDSDTALSLSVNVDPALTAAAEPPQWPDGEDQDDLDPASGWDELNLVVAGPEGSLIQFGWDPKSSPGHAATWAIMCEDEPAARWTEARDFTTWAAGALSGPLAGGSGLPFDSDGPAREWLVLREATFRSLRRGLDPSISTSYFDDWRRLLERTLETHGPKAGAVPQVADFLAVDTLAARGERTLLATHPLRLRWVANHLDRLASQLSLVCDGELLLNKVNEGLHFDLLDRLSPHEQPPILSVSDDLYLAVREESWHEHFALLKDAQDRMRHEWLSELDDASIDVLASVVDRFLETHPEKLDGVSVLLIVRDGGARVVERLITRALRRRGVGIVPTELHVVAPRESFGELEEALQGFEDRDARAQRDLPALHTVLHPWGKDLLPDVSALDLEVDLVIVPNLFGAATTVSERTRRRDGAHGEFDPWRGRTSYVDHRAADDLGLANVSRVLLPDQSDPSLFDWSTLNVRQKLGGPITADGPDADRQVDFVSLQVKFEKGAKLYEKLHELAHWVVTLDAFVGRTQIELLPSAPDVILMTPRVGKNEAYNLLVSSGSGRAFVTSKLAAKLKKELEFTDGAVTEPLYDRGRALFPGLILRCLGLGWAIQELTGLVLSHALLMELAPRPTLGGFEAWVSLDEQPLWFGSAKARADLARIDLRFVEGALELRLTVLESKFRHSEDVEIADKQVRVSLDLLRDALMPANVDRPRADGRFWRAQILDVIEQSSRRRVGSHAVNALSCWGPDGQVQAAIDEEVRSRFLDGDYRLADASGVVCTMSTTRGGDVSTDGKTRSGFRWIRVGREGIRRELDKLVRRHSQEERSPETDPRPALGEEVDATSSAGAPPIDSTRPVHPQPAAVERIQMPAQVEDSGASQGQRGHSANELERRYQRLLDVFAEYDVEVDRAENDAVAEGPGFFVFRVKPGRGVRPEKLMSLKGEIKLKMGLDRELEPASHIAAGNVEFVIPKSIEDRYFVTAESIWARTTFDLTRLYAPIGEDVAGEVVGLDFSSSDSPHLLVAGLTGSGKSVALETILHGLTRAYDPSRLKLLLVDPKETELIDFEDCEHLLDEIGSEPEDAIATLEKAVVEMQRRRTLFRDVRARDLPEYNERVDPGDRLPWWLIVLDEYADLVSNPDDKKEIETQLKRLSQKARASGIHVIVATQKPIAEVINTVVRSNLPAQLALRVQNASDSRVVIGESGAETLAGMGDALLKTARKTVRLQCALYERA